MSSHVVFPYHFSILLLSLEPYHLTNYLNYHLICAPDFMPYDWGAYACSHNPMTDHSILTLDSYITRHVTYCAPDQSGARPSDHSLTCDLAYYIWPNRLCTIPVACIATLTLLDSPSQPCWLLLTEYCMTPTDFLSCLLYKWLIAYYTMTRSYNNSDWLVLGSI